MKINNATQQGINHILLPLMLLMPFGFGPYLGYEPFIFFYCIYIGTLYLGKLTKPVLYITALFQALQLINIGLTDREIYFDQITSFFENPALGYAVAEGHFNTELFIALLSYLCTTLGLIYYSKPLKLSDIEEISIKVLTFLLVVTAAFTSNLHNHNKHPLVYFSQYIQGNVDNQMDDLAETPEPIKIGEDKAKKIIFILGEAQGHLDNNAQVMPHLQSAINKNTATYFSNVTPLGNYTIISTNQIIESVELRDFTEPHTSYLQVPQMLNKDNLYVSSRNLSWGRFEDKINNRFNTTTADCKSINEDCELVGGIDDLEVLNKLVLPFMKDNEAFFITWQMNGSHTPLENKSPNEHKVFEDEYLNSIHYTDFVINHLREAMPEDTWIVFVSDHTQEYKLSKNTPKVLSFIEHKSLTSTFIPANKDSKLTQLDIIDTLFTLQGFKPNHDNTTIVDDVLQNKNPRGIYKSHNKSTRVELKDN